MDRGAFEKMSTYGKRNNAKINFPAGFDQGLMRTSTSDIGSIRSLCELPSSF
jgi:hypothetical protein